MRDLKYFLGKDLDKEMEEVEVEGIDLFKDEKGMPVRWVLKGLTTNNIDKIRQVNTTEKRKKGQVYKTLDEKRIMDQMAIETIIYPNFKDPTFLEAYKEIDPVSLLRKVLKKPQDYSKIITEVNKVNGFSDDEEEKKDGIEEAKN